MVATACPTADELKNYTLGRLSEPDWAAIAEHLESCRQCQAAIATVERCCRYAGDATPRACAGVFFKRIAVRGRANAAQDIEGGADDSPAQPEINTGSKLPVAPDENNTGKMPVPPGVEFEGYQILEELGQGGMGAMLKPCTLSWTAWWRSKFLPAAAPGDQRAIARFEREMKAVGRFDHPHIVRAYDAREISSAPVLIMEFVEGMDLSRLVRRHRPAADGRGLRTGPPGLFGTAIYTRAGAGASRSKAVESDAHPARDGQDSGPRAGSISFRAVRRRVTNSGQAMGTADYMAPEQASDSHAVDIRADITAWAARFINSWPVAPVRGQPIQGHVREDDGPRPTVCSADSKSFARDSPGISSHPGKDARQKPGR